MSAGPLSQILGAGVVAARGCPVGRTRAGSPMSRLGIARPRCWSVSAAYKCSGCGRSWREDLTAAAPERAKLSCRAMRWALEALVVDHLTVSCIAAGLGVSWHTANDAVLAGTPSAHR